MSRPCTASNASSNGFPNKKGLTVVACRRARMDALSDTSSWAGSVSDLAMTGMTFVNADSRCMKSMSLVISLPCEMSAMIL